MNLIPTSRFTQLIVFLSISWFGQLMYSQSSTATEQEIQQIIANSQGKSIWESFFLSFGLGLIDSPKMNSILEEQDLASIDQNGLLIGLGFSFKISENNFIDLEMNLNTTRNREENFGNSFSELGIHLHYHKEVLQLEDTYSFSLGAQASYVDTNMELYQRNQSFNFTDNSFSGNRISFSYPSFRLGPSLMFNWQDANSGKIFMKIQLQYEINIYSSNWKIDDGQLENRINENYNRLNLKLILPLL